MNISHKADLNRSELRVRDLGRQAYLPVWEKMKRFTETRHEDTADELWLLEHDPVFTQGQAGKPEHILDAHEIPIVQTDRGGQVTYHGPGQLMIYTLLDLKRLNLGPSELVKKLHEMLIDLLASFNIMAHEVAAAPGVYVGGAKMASIGLRVRSPGSYHGIALNVDMDLTPFNYINPCGFKNMKMVKIKDFYPSVTLEETKQRVIQYLCTHFNYKAVIQPEACHV